MEEEIPQGLILLREISKQSFHSSYPQLSHFRFVLSCLLRLIMGYLFLLNLFVTIVQADAVINIFFDILALEFVQRLDDVAFALARKDMLGRGLLAATSVEYRVLKREAWKAVSRSEVLRQGDGGESGDSHRHHRHHPKPRRIRCRWILKATYAINIMGLVTGVILIGEKQKQGDYLCNNLSINFGGRIWENALVRNRTDPTQEPQQKTLVYSYFNGVYKLNGTHDGYPKYTEQVSLILVCCCLVVLL